MEKWQRHERHEDEVAELFQRLGFTSVLRGPIHKFDGALFWPEMEKLGHDSTAFAECSCRFPVREG